MKFSTTIASLLRSGDLTPEDYYQLYILSQLLLSFRCLFCLDSFMFTDQRQPESE